MTDTLFPAGTAASTNGTPGRPALTLARVHLRGVGPEAARFDPLDLDHTAAGEPAAKVLWNLTNTGGKTTMIRLISSVVVTGADVAMGKANIGEYVLTADTSHVVLEWADADGSRYVTGALYEWPERTQPADKAISKLNRWWYTFRCDGVGIDDLPFTRDGLRLTAKAYRAELAEVMRDHPAAGFVIEDQQKRWAKVLEERTSLDPALFVYQLRMNDTEAGAGDLVKKLNSPDALVRFFMRTLFDDSALSDFTTTLAAYAKSSGRRSELAAMSEFFGRMVAVLEPLGAAHATVTEARQADSLARYQADEMAARIAARIAGDAAVEQSLSERADTVGAEVGDLYSQIRVNEDIRAQLQLEIANFELAEARDELEQAVGAEAERTRTRDAWAAVEPVVEWRRAQAAAVEAEKAATQAEAGVAPYRQAATAAAARLAAKYEALAAQASEDADRADGRLADLKAAKDDVGRRRDEAVEALAQVNAQLDAITRSTQEADAALDVLRGAGKVRPRESAGDALARLIAQRAQLDEHLDGLKEQLQELKVRIQQAGADRETAVEERRQAESRLEGVRTDLARHAGDLTRVGGHPVIADLTGGAPVEAEQVPALSEAAAAGARSAETALVEVRQRLGVITRELDTLGQTNLAATVEDVEAVTAALTASGIAARTGWSWLADRVTVPARRRAIAEAWPAFASGVVVTDPARLDEARDVAEALAEQVRTAVRVSTVTRLDGLDTAPDPAGWNPGFVVGPRRALYDPEWAASHAEALRAEQTELAERRTSLERAATDGREAAALAGGYLAVWPAETLAGLTASRAGLEGRVAAIGERLEAAEAKLGEATAERDRLETERAGTFEDLRAVETDLGEVRDAAAKAEAAASGQLRRAALENEAAGHQRAVRAADETSLDLEGQTMAAQRAKAEGESRAEQYRQAAQNVKVEPADAEPAESLEELLAGLDAAQEAYSQVLAGLDTDGLERAAKAAQQQAADARGRLSGTPPEVLAAAEALSQTLDGASRGQRAAALAAAQEDLKAAVTAAAQAKAKVDVAAGRVEAFSPVGRNVHANLSEEWRPADIGHARELFDRIVEVNGRLRETHRVREQQLRELTEQLRVLRSGADRLATALDIHPCPEGGVAGVSAWAGSAEQAMTQVKALRDRCTETSGRVEEALRVRGRRAAEVRNTAADWPAVSSPLRDRARSETDDDALGGHAAEWAGRAEIQRRSCAEELEALVQHRAVLVTELKALTSTGQRLLRETTRASRLPAKAGPLAGQPAFKVAFTPLSAAEAEARLERRVDEWADQLAGGKAPGLEERVSWLCTALADTVERSSRAVSPWRVEVLKPDVSGTAVYRTPDRIPVEYSGGQELTLAVMMYCTLAAVRAGQRAGRDRPAGALLLDNPFGKASNATLIGLQQGLAAASGVQLVCATGINDPVVRAAFEGDDAKLIELRNDRDQRRHLRFLRISDPDTAAAVAAAISDGRPGGDPRGYLSGLGYRVRGDG